MNLEDVNGIIIWDDGIPHSFGINKMVLPDEMEDENYHTTSFLKDIYPTEWFQNTGYPYKEKEAFGRQLEGLTTYGFTVLCNTSSRLKEHDDYYCYMINAPENMSDNTKEYIQGIYFDLKDLIERQNAFFQGTIYDASGNYALSSPVFDIDSFYEALDISKGKSTSK